MKHDRYTISDETNVNGVQFVEIETDYWSMSIAEIENQIVFSLQGKLDGRGRNKRWKQSRRLFNNYEIRQFQGTART